MSKKKPTRSEPFRSWWRQDIALYLGDELIDQAIGTAQARGAIRTRDVAEIETERRAAAEA